MRILSIACAHLLNSSIRHLSLPPPSLSFPKLHFASCLGSLLRTAKSVIPEIGFQKLSAEEVRRLGHSQSILKPFSEVHGRPSSRVVLVAKGDPLGHLARTANGVGEGAGVGWSGGKWRSSWQGAKVRLIRYYLPLNNNLSYTDGSRPVPASSSSPHLLTHHPITFFFLPEKPYPQSLLSTFPSPPHTTHLFLCIFPNFYRSMIPENETLALDHGGQSMPVRTFGTVLNAPFT